MESTIGSSCPLPFFNKKKSLARHTSIFLTWKDLWVTVLDKAGGRRPILQGLTGYAKPAEVLAIMGPSGCGKSTLLDVLAGRLDSNARQMGDILINGHKQALAFGTSVRKPTNILFKSICGSCENFHFHRLLSY
ncbi:hypothetical protein Pfo_007841 [Paulownia fortunei]|nr:hypothetical protein Pfo_007841 [Paulownia fortunei]